MNVATQADRDLFITITQQDDYTADSINAGLAFTGEIELIALYRQNAELRAKEYWYRQGKDDQHQTATDRIEALTAENERLREALEAAWKQATTMRNASKLVSPYPDDHAKRSIWVRSLYHEGKRLHELLKPTRAALGDTQ